MSYQIWSWILTAVGITGFWLAGKKVWWCWYINIACQALWFAYAVVTQQWGFLVAAIFYTVVFTKNARDWTREHRAKQKEAEAAEAFQEGWAKGTTTLVDLPPVGPRIVNYTEVLSEDKNHMCHEGPMPNHIHTISCPTGEHLGGWQHMPSVHKLCDLCWTRTDV